MSRQLSSLLKISVAGFVLLSVGACKPADKGQGALKSAGVEALNLSKADTSIFGKYFETAACDVDEMEALGALAGLGLGETGTNNLTFAKRKFEAGRVVYSDFRIETSDTESFSSKQITFHCPQMGEEAPNFERLDLKDATLREDEITANFGTLSVSHPTADAAKALVAGMMSSDNDTSGDIGFGAVSVTGVKVTGDAFSGTLSALAWGEDRGADKRGTADLMLEELKMTVPGKDGVQDMTVDFEGMGARNLNIGAKLLPRYGLSPNGAISQFIGSLNTGTKPYDELIIGDLDVDAEGFSLDFDGIEGKTTEAGDVITTRQSFNPMTITLKPALGENPEFKRAYTILKSLDFETIEMSGSSVTRLDKSDDSIAVSDGLWVIKDAMKLNFEYEAEGLAEMLKSLQTAQSVTSQSQMAAMYEPLKLRSMRFTMEDNSIVARGLKLASEMTGQSEANIKRGLGMLVFGAAMAAENEVQAEVYSETIEAFADFVKNGGTMTIEANPPAPFSLAPLVTGKGADVDPATLGFSASQENEAP
ncbi:hypothetical protein GCM10011309_24080 [Litorimonas cladophorae]|uniref:Lipoprotein n=1 Tax=Litorimonas cladophorae TaxID=1220491 RepID=A0A918KRR0_9PROT|nr:hypothetical protein [Litorimonas cladophorae]GGX73235.1 hypothetical protein GCM10011309_24080 [Litorimonas cladophorae]